MWGGSGPHGYDCSGFVQAVLEKIGLDPKGDQSASGLYEFFFKHGQIVFPPNQFDLGDLAFYGQPGKITHVAICLNSAQCVEAGGGGERTITKEDAEKAGAKIRVVAIDRRKDLIAVIRPNGLPWALTTKACPTTPPT